MQDPLKERLTGAAILVVVVVLAVPEMFRGRQGAAAPAIPPSASALPLRTVTVVDGAPASAGPPSSGATMVPEQAAAQPPGTAPSAVLSSSPTTPLPAAAVTATPVSPAPASAAPAPASEAPQAPAGVAMQHGSSAGERPAPTAGPRPAAPRPAGHPAAPAGQAGTGWAVQVGSFRARELAERMAREVHAKGFRVHVVGPDARGLYRVRSALLPDREAAQALRQQMVARGLKPIVNASP